MKKSHIIAIFLILACLVAGMVTLVCRHDQDKEDAPRAMTRKQPQITELDGPPADSSSLAGPWLAFLHYPDRTDTADIRINDSGIVTESTVDLLQGLHFSLTASGQILLENEHLSIKGQAGNNGDYLQGMATFPGKKNPVPFSACRMSEDQP